MIALIYQRSRRIKKLRVTSEETAAEESDVVASALLESGKLKPGYYDVYVYESQKDLEEDPDLEYPMDHFHGIV